MKLSQESAALRQVDKFKTNLPSQSSYNLGSITLALVVRDIAGCPAAHFPKAGTLVTGTVTAGLGADVCCVFMFLSCNVLLTVHVSYSEGPLVRSGSDRG